MCLIISQTALSKRVSKMVDMQIIVPSYHNATTDNTINTIAVVTNALFRNTNIMYQVTNYRANASFIPAIYLLVTTICSSLLSTASMWLFLDIIILLSLYLFIIQFFLTLIKPAASKSFSNESRFSLLS